MEENDSGAILPTMGESLSPIEKRERYLETRKERWKTEYHWCLIV